MLNLLTLKLNLMSNYIQLKFSHTPFNIDLINNLLSKKVTLYTRPYIMILPSHYLLPNLTS